MVALLVLLTILIFLTADYLVQQHVARLAAPAGSLVPAVDFASPAYFSPHVPLGVYFDSGHTWLFVEESGSARLGITNFAQSLIGKVDRIESLSEGEKLQEGKVILRLHHKDRMAAFRSPVNGVIEKVNTHLNRRQNLREPEASTASWYYRIRPEDMSEIPKKMFLGEAAGRWLHREIERLKVFLATINPENRIAGETIQDGGLPRWELIDSLSNTDWMKIQEKFFS